MNSKRLLAAVGALLFAGSAAAQTNPTTPFQYAIFYNGLLEFTWCAPLTVNGRTHANAKVYTGSICPLTFNGLVTTTGTISSPAWDGQQVSAYTAAVEYNLGYSTNCEPLILSIGATNYASILAQNTNSSSLYYNAANLVLLVSNSTVTLTLQTSSADPQATNITANYYPTNYSPANYVQVTTNFPFLTLTNSFTDQREGDTVKATDINMAILDQWLVTNKTAKAKFPNTAGVYNLNAVPGVLYVADNRTLTNYSTQLTAIRLTHGTFIPTNTVNIAGINQPSGFTVATPNPLYVWGTYYNCPTAANYNSTNTTGVYPASLVSDALTILSAAWVDSESATVLGGNGKAPATSTTINAAILTGIVPSTGSAAYQYSGGVMNLPRLLEDWGSGTAVSLTLNTSLVNLFNSTRATNQWQSPGVYYEAPTRQFSFNQNFLNPFQLPPGTPLLVLGPTNTIITVQPQSQAVCAGQTAVFTVGTTNYPPPSYQWAFNGTSIARATNSAFTITSASATNAGSYSVVVTNLLGTQISSTAALTVDSPPVINTQPASQAVAAGSGVTFSVSAGGTAPLSYQWYYDQTTALAGATGASLVLSNVQSTDVGSYSVSVSNTCGSVNSEAASLTVNVTAPVISAPPQSLTLLAGQEAVFNVEATGTDPLVYQWEFNGTNIADATNSSLSITNVSAGNAGSYAVVVTNAFGSQTSPDAALTVNYPPLISAQPASQWAVAGSSVTFSVSAGGTALLSYQWFFDQTNALAGATGYSLSLSNVQPANAGSYSVSVSNAFGSVKSQAASLTVCVPPVISVPPQSLTLLVGQETVFNVGATGTGPLVYQWQFNGTNLVAATNASLILPSVTTGQAGVYGVTVTNLAGLASASAMLSVYSSAAAVLAAPLCSTGNQFQFTITGVPGFIYTVLASTDLVSWVPLFTNTSPFMFVDVEATNYPARYYRCAVAQANTPPTSGMALIPAGAFMMGDTLDGESDAIPAISVTVSEFYMDATLVTFSQWQAVYNWATNAGYDFDNAGSGRAANNPVQTVDWYDVVKWSNARSQQAGLTPVYYTDAGFTQVYTSGDTDAVYPNWTANGYRLATEAEWEKAARGGAAGHRFPWTDTDTIDWSRANYCADVGLYSYDVNPIGGYDTTFNCADNPVGYFAPNGYGLYDMAGNVYEFCWDWYGMPYAGGTDPHGPATGTHRVVRGGSWEFLAIYARCAARFGCLTYYASYQCGFRCVKGL